MSMQEEVRWAEIFCLKLIVIKRLYRKCKGSTTYPRTDAAAIGNGVLFAARNLDGAIFCKAQLTEKIVRNEGDFTFTAPKTVHKLFGYRSRAS